MYGAQGSRATAAGRRDVLVHLFDVFKKLAYLEFITVSVNGSSPPKTQSYLNFQQNPLKIYLFRDYNFNKK